MFYAVSTLRKLGGVSIGTQLPFCILFSPEGQPMERCGPHAGWGLPNHLNLPKTILIGMPRLHLHDDSESDLVKLTMETDY